MMPRTVVTQVPFARPCLTSPSLPTLQVMPIFILTAFYPTSFITLRPQVSFASYNLQLSESQPIPPSSQQPFKKGFFVLFFFSFFFFFLKNLFFFFCAPVIKYVRTGQSPTEKFATYIYLVESVVCSFFFFCLLEGDDRFVFWSGIGPKKLVYYYYYLQYYPYEQLCMWERQNVKVRAE